MRNTREDRITAEMLKIGGDSLEKAIQTLANKDLYEGRITKQWHKAEVILLEK